MKPENHILRMLRKSGAKEPTIREFGDLDIVRVRFKRGRNYVTIYGTSMADARDRCERRLKK